MKHSTSFRALLFSAASISLLGCGGEDPGNALALSEAQVLTVRGFTLLTDTMPECATCLRLDTLGPIGSIDDPEVLGAMPLVSRGPRGGYVAVPRVYSGHPIIQYDSTGRFVGTLGSIGDGPGEYRFVQDLVNADSGALAVIHDRSSVQVYAADGSLARQLRLQPLIPESAIPWRQEWLVTGALRSGEGVGRPLHHLDSSGVYIRSFGTGDIVGPGGGQTRVMAQAPSGGIWAIDVDNYRIEYFDSTGASVLRLALTVPHSFWHKTFIDETHFDSIVANPQKPGRGAKVVRTAPPPEPFKITGLDDDGTFLWISIRVLKPDWLDMEPPISGETNRRTDVEVDRERFFDTVIDVVDTRTLVLVARTRVAGQGELAGGGRFVLYGYTPDGYIKLTAVKLTLIGAAVDK